MTIQMTAEGLRAIFPKAPRACIEDVAADWQRMLDRAQISHTRTRLGHFFANIEHECGGFTIKNLTENTNYSHQRAAQIWPGRFAGSTLAEKTQSVIRKYGTGPGWQLRMFDDVYGNRMGNRPGTRDGSLFIGHGGPQWTGRDGHEALARLLSELLGVPAMTAEQAIRYAISYPHQPAVCVAFWIWKKLNPVADAGDFKRVVKIWNGGQIGLADRQHLMAGNDAVIARMAIAKSIAPVLRGQPGAPPTPAPPAEIGRAHV